ncbi:MAG: hypothetical protein HFI32_09075 [Lachnospiraceae bacterium]|nr:hypothetical protein [Lachnospiraceae bacterium]
MHAMTVEGLVGASASITLSNTAMGVYKEARNKGDTATMERALGYANEMRDQAEDYKVVADKGMEEDAKAAKEKAELERQEAIQKRREEQEKLEERIEESRNANTDRVEISEEGKAAVESNSGLEHVGADGTGADMTGEPVTYIKTGEVVSVEESPDLSVTV